MNPESATARLAVSSLLHPRERDQFVGLCAATEPAEFADLGHRVEDHIAAIEAAAGDASATDAETGRRVGAKLCELLADPDFFDADGRALVRGAVEYFIAADDGQPDLTDIVGFDDDARILNAVLHATGRAEEILEL